MTPQVVAVSNLWVHDPRYLGAKFVSPMIVCVGIEFLSSIELAVKGATSFI